VAGTEYHDQNQLWYSIYDMSIPNTVKPINEMTKIDIQSDEMMSTVSPIPEEGQEEEVKGGRKCAYPHPKSSANNSQNFSNSFANKVKNIRAGSFSLNAPNVIIEQ
jgi:hypothetical protein